MKLFKLKSILTICLLTFFFSCQKDDNTFCEIENIQLNKLESSSIVTTKKIPEWVSEYVTPEEYELWEVMSTRFSVNYDFLLEDISLKRKNEIYEIVKKCCERIKQGEENEDLNGIFVVAPENLSSFTNRIEQLTRTESGDGPKSQTILVYTSRYSSMMKVKATIDYNKNGSSVNVKASKVFLEAPSGLNAKLNGSINIDYNSSTQRISGEASGSISYETPLPESEGFRENISIIP